MFILIKEMSFFWIIVLLILQSGVITASNVTAAPGFGTTNSNEISAFIISIKITNRIYNDSLEDHQSESYKLLRQDVENVFFDIYRFTPSAQYQEIAEMTFSNGSIIANATVLFGSKQKSGQALKNIFVTNYQEHPSLTLALNISHTADHEPIPVSYALSTNILEIISTLDSPSTNPNSSTTTDVPSTTLASASSDQGRDINTSTSTTPQSSFTTEAIKSTKSSHSISNNISSSSSSSSSSTADHPNDTSTMSATNASTTMSSTTTMHRSSTASTISASSSLITSARGANGSTIPSSTTMVHTSSKVSAMPVSSSTTTVLPGRNTTNMSLSNSSVSPGKTVTQKPTEHEGSDIEQGVPGWGIAILVLAAVILFFMLVLLILLLLFWCCWWRQRGFMNVSDPDPTGYYNPDIPMYSTHSTYDSHNGKSLDSNSERTPKNRTGTYKVNK